MIDPMVHVFEKYFVEDAMIEKRNFTAEEIFEMLPKAIFNLDDEEYDFTDLNRIIEDLANDYDYTWNGRDWTWTDVFDENSDPYIDDEEDDDLNTEITDEAESVVYTANKAGQLTIPAKFISQIAEPGEDVAYACYGAEVSVFPASNTELLDDAYSSADKVIIYHPHFTSGHYEVRRSMNKLFTECPDARDTAFDIVLDVDNQMVHVYLH